MLRELDGRRAETIVEIGAGKGELTTALITKRRPFTSYYAFEIDATACTYLQNALPGITVLQESAFAFPQHLPKDKKIDLFVSSIPLSFYPSKKINGLLDAVRNRLDNRGTVIIIFSAFWLIRTFRKKFPGAKVYFFFTFPFYFILVYKST